MIAYPGIFESNCMFNTCRVELIFVHKYRLYSMQVILGRYRSFSACKFNFRL